ncbi:fimbria/pilus outer membrane usher protein [Proteus mirabilis]|uniref:fimbria/pilus outer membrane usher protein n=1 Tax=Proteus mirabilis TaxID=584 RepID=UPI0039B53970
MSFSTNSAEIFNPEFLKDDMIEEGINISDLSKFEKVGYNNPGKYFVDLYINNDFFSTEEINFKLDEDDNIYPCLNVSYLLNMGVDIKKLTQLSEDEHTSCLNISKSIPNSSYNFNFQKQSLYISIPQAYIMNNIKDYVSPSLWDNGIKALFLNYNLSGSNGSRNSDDYYLSINSGINLGSFQFRNLSSWQYSKLQHKTISTWNSIYTYLQKPIISIKSTLLIGESSTTDTFFNSIGFRGIKLNTSDDMFPNSQQGYAPTIKGIAKTNAKVSIKQNGYIVYQTNVSPGPFEISDLTVSATGGDLVVIIDENDGTIQSYSIPFSTIPLLQRENRFKYETIAGEYRNGDRNQKKIKFLQGSLIYGLTNETSIYLASQLSKNYQSILFGFGQNLGNFGAVSLDITHAKSKLVDNKDYNGQSLRLLYAKSFNKSQTTMKLLAYRYSTKNFYNLSDTTYKSMIGSTKLNDDIVTNYYNLNNSRKGKFQGIINQSLGDYGSIYASITNQSYWNTTERDEWYQVGYNTSYNGINYSLSYSRNKSIGLKNKNNSFNLNINIPLRIFYKHYSNNNYFLNDSYLTMSATNNSKGNNIYQTGISGTLLDEKNLSYSIKQGNIQRQGYLGSIDIGYQGVYGDYSLGYFYDNVNKKINYSISGSAILHEDGLTFGQNLNETAILVKAPGASNVSLTNYTGVKTDWRGYAILPYAMAYRMNRVELDTNSLQDNIEIQNNIKSIAPINGAISRLSFDTSIGIKALLHVKYNNKNMPFGTIVNLKSDDTKTSIVGDDGQLYITGLPIKGALEAKWGIGPNDHCEAQYDFESMTLNTSVLQTTIYCN